MALLFIADEGKIAHGSVVMFDFDVIKSHIVTFWKWIVDNFKNIEFDNILIIGILVVFFVLGLKFLNRYYRQFEVKKRYSSKFIGDASEARGFYKGKIGGVHKGIVDARVFAIP